MKTVTLNEFERAEVFKQDPATKRDGGFQSLMVRFQERLAPAGTLVLTLKDMERIQRYAFKYGNGGWEDRLTSAFGRHLGPKLDQI